MYFSEQGNVDDDATLITIFLVSFNLQSCCLMQSAVCSLRSAVCSLQMSYTGIAHRVAHRVAHGLAHGRRPRFCPHPTTITPSTYFV